MRCGNGVVRIMHYIKHIRTNRHYASSTSWHSCGKTQCHRACAQYYADHRNRRPRFHNPKLRRKPERKPRIEAFLSTRLKLKPNEVYDVYEVDAEGV